MRSNNLLFILSDQHNKTGLGCYGGPGITPNLDALADQGTRFDCAYTNSPICVPAKASLATGRYVHEIRCWDNAMPYNGTIPSWAHQLQDQGLIVDSIGKLHFRHGSDNNGFRNEIEPLHVVDGIGDLLGCVRENSPQRDARSGVLQAGPGGSSYLKYDERNAANAVNWLRTHAAESKPWVLFLSFVCPHPPYVGPESWYRKYRDLNLPFMPQWQPQAWPQHPALAYLRHFFRLNQPFNEEQLLNWTAAYYSACSHLDTQIGRVIEALKQLELMDSTRIIYTSDHGESLGARGLSGKFSFYDESASVPLILSGPDVPIGKKVSTPVSLVDCYPTVLKAVGCTPTAGLPGMDLWQLASDHPRARTIFSEYHSLGSTSASFLLRNTRYKYIYYVNSPPQLFDVLSDPEERKDLFSTSDPTILRLLRRLEDELRVIVDPEKVDKMAKADQADRVAAYGGRSHVLNRGSFTNSPTPDEQPKWICS